MRIRVTAVVVAATTCIGFPAAAQVNRGAATSVSQYVDPIRGLSVDAAIERALEAEPALRAVRTEVDAARAMSIQAGLRPNPSVEFVQQNEPGGTDQQTRIEVAWPLDLLRRGARVAAAERDVDVARHGAADRERLLAGQVRSAYGEVAAAVRDLSIIEELSGALSKQLALVRGRVQEGATPPVERDMLHVEFQRVEADRLLQAGRVEQALVALKRLLGILPDAPLAIRSTLEALVDAEARAAPDDLLDGRPDLQEARARVEAANAQADLARREGRPDVTLFGMYMRMDAGFPQRGFAPVDGIERVRGVFHNVGAGAMVTVPLFNRNQGAIQAADARRAGAAARMDAAELAALSEAEAALARDRYARQAAALYTSEARTLAQQTLEVVRQTYELGRATVFDVLAEQRRYLDVERGYTGVLAEVYQARQALRLALGDVR